MSEQLKPCPWCGKQPNSFPSGDGTGTMIECQNAACPVSPHVSYYGEGVAAQHWNRRLAAAPGWVVVTDDPATWPANEGGKLLVEGDDGARYLMSGMTFRHARKPRRLARWMPWPAAAVAAARGTREGEKP